MEYLNQMFHTNYQQSIANVHLDESAVIIVNRSNIILLEYQPEAPIKGQTPMVTNINPKRTEMRFQDPHFHNVKIAAHTVALISMVGKLEWNRDKIEQLNSIKTAIENNLDIEDAKVRLIFDCSLDLIEKLLCGHRNLSLEIGLIEIYLDTVRPILESLILNITRDSLNSLHQVVTSLLQRTSKDTSIYAVFITTHYASPSNIYGEYLLAMLDEIEVGTSVFVLDYDTDEQGVVEFITTHLVNQELGDGIFRDQNRLHIDVLGPAGKVVVQEMVEEGKLPIRKKN
ncbi:hypothetical protein HDV01_007659 [Terramyces sp. JEL0728]|nr:hypothetical protein HDV01_007659 [Terramyces sp. JEL0728]